MTQLHAFRSDDALGLDDACALADRLARGEVSEADVLAACAARAAQVDPLLRGIEWDSSSAPTRRPVRSRPSLALNGVPTFIKDNIDVAGWVTGQGSQAVPRLPQPRDSEFVAQFLGTGLVAVGKSRMPEFGFSASTEFVGAEPTRNPWHIDFSSGASSGGAAALVAAGVVPIAHANDGGGSIRIPAACCGLVGLKPTRGRLVVNAAQKSLPINVVCDGAVTRTVRDTARFFAAAEAAQPAAHLPRIGHVTRPIGRRLRIGLVMDSPNGTPTDRDTRDAVERLAHRLQALGHRVEETTPPLDSQFVDDFSHYWGFLAYMVQRWGHRLFHPDFDARRLEPLSVGLAERFRSRAWQTPTVLWRLKRAEAAYRAHLTDWDVVLSPTLAHTTPELGYLTADQPFQDLFPKLQRYVGFTPLHNVTGAPGLSLPVGLDRRGLPIGAHLSAAHGEEGLLLGLALEIEADQPFPTLV